MRRAWGAPPPPKPATERRAEAAEPQPQPAAPHQPAPPLHPFLRPPRPQHGGRSPGKPTRQSAQLSSGELVLLRQSLLELRLPGRLAAGSGGAANSTADMGDGQEIPDQVVLRELGARLGRLDSAKRRVLLQVLELRISSTWGDTHFVGLTGLELFDSDGQLLTVRDPARQVSASPSSINVLPEYGSDPRTPDKLLDGVNLTCDCAHMWLAPFTPGALHTVTVTLDAAATLGALRIWNYSKSRVGALRGARLVEVALDGAVIFRGEVRQAPGSVAGALQAAELVLFTEEPAALAAIEQHDRQRYLHQVSPPGSAGDAASSGLAPAAAAAAELDLVTAGGPASPRGQLACTATLPVLRQPGKQQLGADGRPLTSAQYMPPAQPRASAAAGPPHDQRRATASSRGSSTGAVRSPGSGSGASLLHCRELAFIFLDTWGDSHFVGLSGLEVLGADRQPLPLLPAQLAAHPPDLNVFPGHKGDIRTVDKLVDGNNCTMDDTSMWLAPMRRQLSASVAAGAQRAQRGAGGSALSVDRSALPEAARPYNVLLVRLAPPAGGSSSSGGSASSSGGGSSGVAVCGLRVWNYNKSRQDTARGVKRMVVLADGVEVSPPGGVLVRRAPGDAVSDFGQFIPLTTAWSAAAAAASKARRRSTLQPGGAPAGQQQQQQHQQQLIIHPESLAWACSLPDPVGALDCIQRAALQAKAAGPGGTLVGQPGECFATTLPCGFSLKFVLLSSWGCPHYIGLSGLEVRDAVRGPLHPRPDQVWAAPASVATLPGMAADVRTPDKLVDSGYSGAPQHSWLAPQDRQEGNCVHLTLDRPVLLSAIRVWNYARTPSRGVQEMEVYLDEQLVWKGVLQRAPADLAPGEEFAQTLCFSEEAVQEAAAAARRRAAAAARPAAGRHGGAGSAAAAAGGSLPGAQLGAEGVEEWCEQQERVVLFNNGYVEPPPADSSVPPSARPATALVAA
ncbi:hypothetical protein C2E21_2538 [Chlorella sorokiniana]|uniref:KATNIP domain-containing protein n=1 Tax=Chlorella sorokiniana TaxID=3076 RepID=A0A2P6TYY8_CHLSO|nr:hypothetical protein C2E21_2538 [Chlorella sorokiniana]|eukprot:PRW59281.1 hypothetical protein C2E21_2538 [Chlorella sorokiniana]